MAAQLYDEGATDILGVYFRAGTVRLRSTLASATAHVLLVIPPL